MKRIFHLSSLFVFCFILCSLSVKATLPTVTANPMHDTACTGSHAMFAVAAIDTPGTLPISFKWQVSTDGGSSWADIVDDTVRYLGSDGDTLDVIAGALLNGYWYRVRAFNTDGADTSLGAMLTVHFPAAAIAGPSAVCISSSITLTNAVAGGTWSRLHPATDTITPAGGVLTGYAVGYDTVKYTVTNACGVTDATYPIRVDATATAMPIVGPTTTCVGNVIHLTNSNVVGTWVWSTSNGNASVSGSGNVTGVSWGSVVVTYAFTNACNTVTSVIGIMVDTVLNPGTISGATGLCTGSWIHLTASVPGGTWLSSSSSVAVVASGNVTGVSEGVATISYIVSNGCGASIATHMDTVSRSASMIAGLDSVGVGLTRALSDSAAGGTWSIDDTLIATISSTGVVTGVDTGMTNITYMVTNYCGTTYAVITMHVGPAPEIPASTGADVVCVGANTTLANTYAGGVWSSSNDSIATVNSSGVVHGVKYGVDTIYYSVTNGFGTTVTMKTVTVDQAPVVTITGPSAVSLGMDVLLRAIPYGATGTWTTSNNVMGNIVSVYDSALAASFATFVVLNFGHDTIRYTVSNSCGTGTNIFYVSLAPVVINSLVKDAGVMNIYPNPAQGSFSVNLVSAANEDAVVTITNVLGEKVKELTVSTNKKTDIKLDVPAGMYMLSGSTSTGTYSGKITIAQ